jgi:hypothetical protein
MISTRKTSISSRSFGRILPAALILMLVTGCAAHVPLERSLPPAPARLLRQPPVPQLDSACHFPWFKVEGCRGKDPNAMLLLTVSDSIEVRSRLNSSASWFEGVRRSYSAQTRR